MNKIAIYPGTFDPITFGHLDILQRSRKLFDKVIIVVSVNPSKDPMFSIDERLELIRGSICDWDNVDVESHSGLTVDFAESHQAISIIRGLRAISDFEYELQMALMNRRLKEKISTIFMAPHEKYTYLNSSIVKQVAKFGGDISNFVPPHVEKAILNKIQ